MSQSILVTGSSGFIGSHLVQELRKKNYNVMEYDKGMTSELERFCETCDFVFHLAGVNRPKEAKDFITGNTKLTDLLIQKLMLSRNPSPIVFTSSIQADLDNPYGRSKKEAEEILFHYEQVSRSKVYIYRLPNIFGSGGRPNYNSVIATFCYNVSHNLPITIHNPSIVMNLVYIDDLMKEFIAVLEGREGNKKDSFYMIPTVYKVTVGEIADIITSFKEERYKDYSKSPLIEKLYTTYKSYNSENN